MLLLQRRLLLQTLETSLYGPVSAMQPFDEPKARTAANAGAEQYGELENLLIQQKRVKRYQREIECSAKLHACRCKAVQHKQAVATRCPALSARKPHVLSLFSSPYHNGQLISYERQELGTGQSILARRSGSVGRSG